MSTDVSVVISASSENLPSKNLVDALSDNFADSHFLCFEGFKATWGECLSWFSGFVLWSHFVWINQMCRTVADSKQLVWLEMGSFEDACTLRGYLTHRTTPDKSLVVGHFVSEATFKVAIRNSTNKWIRPSPPAKPRQDDPMEGPSHPPLVERPASRSKKPSVPGRDFTLLNRTGVTLEEREEGTLPRRHFRGGKRHKKKKPKVD